MGSAVSTSGRLTSASDVDRGKIECNNHNQNLLENVWKFVQDVNTLHPREAEVVFEKPFTWFTRLSPADFEGTAMGYEIDGKSVHSASQSSSGKLHLSMEMVSESYELQVCTFKELSSVLSAAGEKKTEEVRLALQDNQDPVSVIMGPAFANIKSSDNALMQAHKMLSQQTEPDQDNPEGLSRRFHLLLLINQLEINLLHCTAEVLANSAALLSVIIGCLNSTHRDVKLTADSVEREFIMLQEFSGNSSNSCIEKLAWATNYTFNTGCRAPPWRQVHGDIAYIELTTKEGLQLSLTATTSGYYENGGKLSNGDIDYEYHGNSHKSLTEILKEKSTAFLDAINSKQFVWEERDENNSTEIKHTNEDVTQEDRQFDADLERPVTKGSVKSSPKSKENSKKAKTKVSPGTARKQRTSDFTEEKEKTKINGTTTANSKPTRRTNGKMKETGKHTRKTSASQANGNASDSSSESEEEEENQDRRQESNADLPSEYWQIQKLVKYLKGGYQTATVIALCVLRDFQLTEETCQFAIRDVGGLETLINLLETKDVKCKIGALKILKEISLNLQIRKAIADLGGLQTMVKILTSPEKQLRCLSAETIAHVARFRRARRAVRQFGGIKKLVSLLDCGAVATATEADINVARAGALALWSCSRSTKNKVAIRKAGGIPLLAKLLKSTNESMLIPVVGTLQECASEPTYRLAIRTEGMVEDLVRNLKSEDAELQRHCASAIFKCAEDLETRTLVRDYGGLDPLVALLANIDNKELLAAVTGAIWKCAICQENVVRFQDLKAIEQLVALLSDQPEEVLINVVGALGECAKIPANRQVIRKAGGISPMVNLLTGTNQQLLVNVTRAVGECAAEADNMAIIDRLDGVRLLWSLLKSANSQVQASAAWAICPCIENAKDAGEMVRSFVGGLELIVGLLKSEETEVLASVCAAISKIAIDEENLAVITDHGVVVLLAKLTDTTDDKLRHHLAEAIARCCTWGNNRVSFGKANAVAPLVRYLRSKNPDVHRSTAKALNHLSYDANNCIAMHGSGVVQPLLTMVGSSDEVLQSAAAGCLSNIRRLALANEKAKYN